MKPIHTKGDLMRLVFTDQEIHNVDPAIPIELWNKLDTSIHVMDYNPPHALGKLTNLVTLAYERNITVADPITLNPINHA